MGTKGGAAVGMGVSPGLTVPWAALAPVTSLLRAVAVALIAFRSL